MRTLELPPEYFTLENGYAAYRPQGEVSIDEVVEMVDGAVRYCRRNRISALLIDLTVLTGFVPPSIPERYWYVKKWASGARGQVILAIVVRPEFIHPNKIGVTIASGLGLTSDVFADGTKAVEWLLITLRAQESYSVPKT